MTYAFFRDALLECLLNEMVEKGEITQPMADRLRKIVYENCYFMVDLISPGGPEVLEPSAEL